MIRLQEWIHAMEEGEGTRVVRLVLALLALLALTVVYDLGEYRNYSSAEAMDAAQLARNLAEGKGYTTLFVRPLSLGLVEQRQMKIGQRTNDFGMLKAPHPDIANPPVYPVILAGLMKALPFNFEIARQNIWRVTGSFRYQPEVLVSFFNQALFFLAIFLMFRLARRLFDPGVAWLSALVLAGSDVFWRFTVSGLSTMLLVVIFLGLVWCLVGMEPPAPESNRGPRGLAAMAALAGLLVGLGALTRYSFGWLIVPLLAYFALYFGERRTTLCLAASLAFAAVLAPWLARNYGWSGTLFGTAGYAVSEDTGPFPGNQLERSLTPDLSVVTLGDYRRKLLLNLGGIFQNDLPKIGGSWISAFFLTGLLVRFVSATLGRLRVFTVMSLLVLTAVQALGRTQLSGDAPEINSENLLVLLAPLVIIFGGAMFSLLLDQLDLVLPPLRRLAMGAFVVLSCAPLIFTVLPPREYPLAYPPYVPPWVQQFGDWMEEKEMVMSDMPWAMAWYGRRQCIWTTLKVQDRRGRDDFFAINDLRKPVHAIYLSTLSLDARFHSQLLAGEDGSWERFMLDSLASTNGLPARFPLRHLPTGQYLVRGQFFLTDWVRWGKRDAEQTR